MRRRSAVARLARNVLVGDLKEDFLMTVRMISTLPDTPRQKVRLHKFYFEKFPGLILFLFHPTRS